VRIVFVARRWWPAVGGVETYARHLARGLAARHRVTVLAMTTDSRPTTDLSDSLAPRAGFQPFDDGPVRVVPLRIPLPRRTLMAPLALQVLPGMRRFAYGQTRRGAARLYATLAAPVIAGLASGADVVQMWGSDLLAAGAVAAARRISAPVVVEPFSHGGQWGDDPASAAAFRRADAVVAQLEAEAGLYRELGVARERIAICGICSPGVEAGGGERIRRRFDIRGPLVVFLGVRRHYKGFDVALEAASAVGRRRSDVTFAFVGPGEPLGADGSRVIDAGAASEEDKAGWLEAADLLCLPSAGEIFPVSFLEAWSVRTPVVTTDTPTLAELMHRSGGGLAVAREPVAITEAILGLIDDPQRRDALAESGRLFWSRHHNVDAVTRCHESLYRRLLVAGTGAEA
jgi:glycosyltransferase involved in cell wall biosynthesis